MWTVRGAVAIGLLVQAQALHYPDCRFTVSGGSTCITVCSQLSTYRNCLQHMCTDKQRTAETLAETCQTMTSKIAQLGCTCPRHCTFDGCLVNHDCTSWVCSGGGFVWLLINSVLLLGLLFVFYKCYNRYHNNCARQWKPTSAYLSPDSNLPQPWRILEPHITTMSPCFTATDATCDPTSYSSSPPIKSPQYCSTAREKVSRCLFLVASPSL